ncbi:MAG: 4Fe-4S binding protein [Peptococcaceae bacterium]|nr:4Fe-4S binding protein [Peptococcaceae bacterium]
MDVLTQKRSKLQTLTWLGLPLVAVVGWWYPLLGFLLFGCMIGAVAVAFFRGRHWCDWMCPRGAFFDVILGKISPKSRIPSLFRHTGLRVFMIVIIFSVIGTQFYFHWGNAEQIGLALVRVLTVTTVIGILLGLIYHPRVWCHICPMGTLAHWLSEGKRPLTLQEGCAECGRCAAVCPMQLEPHQYRADGIVRDNDCIKCASCIAACPKKILVFADYDRKAA